MSIACPSCLDDPQVPIVIDTSVVINLATTGYAEVILQALPNQFHIAEEVSLEIKQGSKKYTTEGALTRLVQGGHLSIIDLGQEGRSHFVRLIAGRATETLDDGEAATIASALEHRGVALIDERKALRICTERFAHLRTGYTVDLLTHRNVRAALGHDKLGNAVFKALYHGRMRVPHTYKDSVVNLIGPSRASKCNALSTGVLQNTYNRLVGKGLVILLLGDPPPSHMRSPARRRPSRRW